jgi:hypothetical protein
MTDECTAVLHAVPCDVATCMYYTGIDPFTKPEHELKHDDFV